MTPSLPTQEAREGLRPVSPLQTDEWRTKDNGKVQVSRPNAVSLTSDPDDL